MRKIRTRRWNVGSTTISIRGIRIVTATRRLLEREAAALGKTIQIETVINEAAFAALLAGNRTEHNRIVHAEMDSLAARVDVIVLGQISLAQIEHRPPGVPVLQVGHSGFAHARRLLNDAAAANGGHSARGVYNAGMRGKKRFLYEGGHRVPLFIRWPAGKLRHGRDVAALAEVQDVFPTLVDLVGISPPAQAQFEGVSLAPVLRGETQQLPDRILIVQYPRENAGKGDAAVLWRRWRLVHDKELYDLDADPGQTADVAAGHPEIVARLRTHYESWWSQIEPRLKFSWPARLSSSEQSRSKQQD